MQRLSSLDPSEWSLKRKLFGYMMLLAALPAAALILGLFLFDRFGSIKKSIYESLDIQLEFFEKGVTTQFDHLSAAGIRLSEDMTVLLESYLDEQEILFDSLNDSETHISALQDNMVEPMKQKLLQEDCSGIFVMLDVTVNDSLPDSEFSKSGIYLQVNGYDVSEKEILLYRGMADIGKQHDSMPHRKWRLEFQTDQFPDYEKAASLASKSIHDSCLVTSLFTLPGTSEKAILITTPITGSDGTYYGICGFEISASCFMTYHAQPTKIKHLTCLLTPGDTLDLNAGEGLSCGVQNGYYRTPSGILSSKPAGEGMVYLNGSSISYIGLTRTLSLSPNNDAFTISSMMLKSDYDKEVRTSFLQNITLWLLLIFFTIHCCLFFSRRFLTPLLKDLEQIRDSQWSQAHSDIPEINDLFEFLAAKDKEHEQALSILNQEKEEVQTEIETLQRNYLKARTEYERAQAELSKLASSRIQDVDPESYRQFLDGIQTLTPTERKIFNHYLSGKSVKEIMEIASIKESTLRYHNQNIYGKLGVNSLKQLLRCAALMKQKETPIQ